MKPRLLTFADYLDAVERLHHAGAEEIAEAAGVSAAEVRRWRRGTRAPGWATVDTLARRYGGDARLVYLGIVLDRFARQVGCGLDEAARLPFSRRRAAPSRRPKTGAAAVDRRQMSLLAE